eukprot:1143853-Pelagomonas_calceolata.AAC.5
MEGGCMAFPTCVAFCGMPTCRVEELYGGMQAASQGAGPRPAPTQSMVAEQIYAVGEQCLVEGLY